MILPKKILQKIVVSKEVFFAVSDPAPLKGQADLSSVMIPLEVPVQRQNMKEIK